MTSNDQTEVILQLSHQIAELIRACSVLRSVGGTNQDEVEETLKEKEGKVAFLRKMRQEYEDKVIGNY